MNIKKFMIAAIIIIAPATSVMANAPYSKLRHDYNQASFLLRVENTEKSIGFYQRLLEQWCRTYFEDCFDCEYKKNSLTNVAVNSRNSSETQLVMSGKCSYSGWFDHNDVPFKARITYMGNDNYEVWFEKGARAGYISETVASATRKIAYWE